MNGGGIFGSRDNRGNFTQLPTSPARTPNFHQGTSTHQISVGACPNLLFKQKPAARYNITTSSSDSYKDFITQNRSLTGTKDNKPWAVKDDLNQWGERALVARNGLSVNRTYSHTVSRLQPELASSKTPKRNSYTNPGYESPRKCLSSPLNPISNGSPKVSVQMAPSYQKRSSGPHHQTQNYSPLWSPKGKSSLKSHLLNGDITVGENNLNDLGESKKFSHQSYSSKFKVDPLNPSYFSSQRHNNNQLNTHVGRPERVGEPRSPSDCSADGVQSEQLTQSFNCSVDTTAILDRDHSKSADRNPHLYQMNDSLSLQDKQQKEIRIALFGLRGVGKSSIILQFIRRKFRTHYIPTIEDTYQKELETSAGRRTLRITDTNGNFQFPTMQRKTIANSHVILLVFSVDSRESLEFLSRIHEDIIKYGAKHPPKLVVLVGNKCDRREGREVSQSSGLSSAKSWGCPYVETSAKDDTNVADLFCGAAKLCVESSSSPLCTNGRCINRTDDSDAIRRRDRLKLDHGGGRIKPACCQTCCIS